jgi:beta-lactamase regulating signal transducer with metallopeptidase domain
MECILKGDFKTMLKPCLLRITLLLALSITFAPLAIGPALAQNSSTTTATQTSSPAQTTSNTSKQTSTTTTTQTAPTQTTTTQTTGVDPLWIAAGVVGLLALLAIVLLATRGRSRDRVATVRESTTVVKKD